MNKVVSNYIHFQRQGVNYLKHAYGLTHNKALSVYGKVRWQIASEYANETPSIETINRLTTNAIKHNVSQYNPISATINSKDMSFSLKTFQNEELEEAFRITAQNRLADFNTKYINTETYSKIYNEYFVEKKITYREFKSKLEAFKKSDVSYAGGS